MRPSPASELSYRTTPDVWLGERLGKPTWRVALDDGGARLNLLTGAPAFAYAKVSVADVAVVRDLVGYGFYPVDVAVTFAGPAQSAATSSGCRFARPTDREAVAELARSTFRYSRFHLDPQVPRQIAADMKAEWAANFFAGARGDAMVVAESGGAVVGFLQIIRESADTLLIDLIGVAGAHQGKGIARAMIEFLATHGTGDGRKPVQLRVGTQAANTPSVRLYESCGLRLAGAQYVLHFHS